MTQRSVRASIEFLVGPEQRSAAGAVATTAALSPKPETFEARFLAPDDPAVSDGGATVSAPTSETTRKLLVIAADNKTWTNRWTNRFAWYGGSPDEPVDVSDWTAPAGGRGRTDVGAPPYSYQPVVRGFTLLTDPFETYPLTIDTNGASLWLEAEEAADHRVRRFDDEA